MDVEPAPKEGLGTKMALALILSVCFFFGSYVASTIISEIMSRRGLPGSPLIFALALFPFTVLLVLFEQRVQDSDYWPKIERYWYPGIVAVGSGIPIVLTIVAPLLFWTSLPRGGPIGVAITAMIAVALAVFLRGAYANRKNNP